MRKLLILLLFLAGCTARSPLYQSNKDPAFKDKVNNLLVINYMDEYDQRYGTSISPYFERYLSEKLSQVGIKNQIVKPPSILNLQSQSEAEKNTDKNFDYILTLRPYHYSGDRFVDIQASLWRRGDKNYIWKGIYKFNGGGGWSQEGIGNTLAERIFLGLQYDDLIGANGNREQIEPSTKSGLEASVNNTIPEENKFNSIEAKLASLKKLLDKGLINKSEYDAKKQSILNSL